MTEASWDPDRYLRFADERGRPFVDLLARVGATDPELVVDLGCGPGNLTGLLTQRWPEARVLGVDSSPEMIATASARGDGAEYSVADLTEWRTVEPVDVLISNAALQWVPGHLDLLPTLLDQVRPGGWFAFQVPGNFDAPSHTIRRDLEAEDPFAEHAVGLERPGSHDPAEYWRRLADLGCDVDAWETTYLHVLSGPDPVFTWVSATSARPILNALPDQLRDRFEADFKQRLAATYPSGPHGVLLPFRRVFVVARKRAGEQR